MPDAEPLPDAFAAALRATADRRGPIASVVQFYSETTSTNDVAARLAEQGAPAGTTVVARSQTAGRGRRGRTWFSPPGAGLYVSVIFRDPAAAPLLTLAAGVAIAEGICAATGLQVHIKWPNDLVVGQSAVERPRKIAGILAEAAGGSEGVQFVVLGYGINLRAAVYPADIAARATSLEAEIGRSPDERVVLAETLAALNERSGQLACGRSDEILTRWRRLAPSAYGTAVRWQTPSGVASGFAQGIDETGALLVQVADSTQRIISGELHWD